MVSARALIALLALAGLYAGDYLSARYRIPGNRQTLGACRCSNLRGRLKDGRIEYLLGDADTETCVRSLFPQLGTRLLVPEPPRDQAHRNKPGRGILYSTSPLPGGCPNSLYFF